MNEIKYISYYEIKKSKFYTYIFQTSSKEEFNFYLNKIREQEIKSKHITYAYSINNNEYKYNSSTEPCNIGVTYIKLLEKIKITNISIFVVRYYGGIKLGSSLLLRTYKNCALNGIKKYILEK